MTSFFGEKKKKSAGRRKCGEDETGLFTGITMSLINQSVKSVWLQIINTEVQLDRST